jgi:hypothetical protein
MDPLRVMSRRQRSGSGSARSVRERAGRFFENHRGGFAAAGALTVLGVGAEVWRRAHTRHQLYSEADVEASPKRKGLVVLTYNVLHEIGHPTKIQPCENDACIKNVCKFIDTKAAECDFIGIQEYAEIDKLSSHSTKLRSMGLSHTEYEGKLLKYGPITFYNKEKYVPDAECSHMKFGFLGKLGRGIQINFFNGWLCVINVHAGHKGKGDGIDKFETSLHEYLNSTYCKAECKQEFIKKLQEYDIIMLGDMNDHMNADFSFRVQGTERRLGGRTIDGTCCGDKRTMDGVNTKCGAYDHILSTLWDPQKTKTKVYTGLKHHSDHNPVKSTMVFK